MNLVKSIIAVSAGLGIYLAAAPGVARWAFALPQKAVGADIPCDWGTLAKFPWVMEDLTRKRDAILPGLKVTGREPASGLVQVATASRRFWLREEGEMGGTTLVAFYLAERQWNHEGIPGSDVRKGDVVIDVGAHVGTFTGYALERGASKVIAVEPDPVNVECLRRNFAAEIAAGRVVVVPEGAWSKESTLELSVGIMNSGSSSLVNHERGAKLISVPVRPLDAILAKIGIERADYLKMDIEGAEKDALEGAREMIRRSKPRIHLDANHLPDDAVALPAKIASIRPDYRVAAGHCECNSETGSRFTPHTLFFQ